MALEGNEGGNGMVMPVAPFYGNGNGNGFGGDWAWIILLLLLGWGNNGWGNGGGYGGIGLYPWMNQSNQISDGFRDQMLNTSINSIQNGVTSGFGDVQNALCGGFAGVNAAITNAQMANMQQAFAMQSQFSDCCCENRLATCQTQNVIQNEGSATRFADANNTRDLLTNQTANTQAILDKLCQLELDAKNDKISDLERQLTMANLAASQTAQTSRILADNAAQTVALEQYLNPVPIPAYVVQNPNCCTANTGCGCGGF